MRLDSIRTVSVRRAAAPHAFPLSTDTNKPEVFLEDLGRDGANLVGIDREPEPAKTAAGGAPASVTDLKSPIQAMKKLGYDVGKTVSLKKPDDAGKHVYLIMSVTDTVVLKECTFDHIPDTITIGPDELVKEFSLHKSQLQIMMPKHNAPLASVEWETDAFHAAIVLALRKVMKDTEFDPDGVHLFKGPYGARAARGYGKGTLKLVAASNVITTKKSDVFGNWVCILPNVRWKDGRLTESCRYTCIYIYI